MRVAVAAFAWNFLLLGAWYVLRPLRDQVGAAHGSRDLPWLFSATFAAMLVAHPLYGALTSRFPRRVFVPAVYHFFAVNLLAFWWFLPGGSALLGHTFFVWTSVFNLFVLAVMWSVLADTFSTDEGRRLFPWIAAGGSLGAVCGSAVTAGLVETVGSARLPLLAAVLLEAGVACATVVLRAAPAPTPPGRGAFAGFARIPRSPYLLGLTAWMFGLTITATFVYAEQAELVRAALPDPDARTAFFARIDLVVNVLTLAVQAGATPALLRFLGAGPTLAMLPALVAAGFAALAVAPGMSTLAVFQVARRTGEYAVARPAREVLYTLVAREDKYQAKHLIDTVAYRGGDQVGIWLDAALRAAGAAGIAVALPLALGWGALSVWLGRARVSDRE